MTQRPRAALYARFSTDKQSIRSIDDQWRECETLAKRHGFDVVARYGDAAISGGTAHRPDYQQMLTAARLKPRPFDVIVAEDISRLWRKMAEQSTRLAELKDLGLNVVTVDTDTRQESSLLMSAVHGALNEHYCAEIGRRGRRGLEGKARDGLSTGGRSYGYIPAAQSGTDQLEIDPVQAKVVVRMFTDYANGISRRNICEQLNREGVPSPRGGKWLQSTLWGDPAKGTGILNNALYTGKVIWGKESWKRSAQDSSRRKRVLLAESEWIVREVERLRIIPQALWERVKKRQATRTADVGVFIAAGIQRSRRKKGHPVSYLLSGLVKCPECSAGYVVAAHKQYVCATHHNGGASACSNAVRFLRPEAEAGLLSGLKSRMLSDDAVAAVRQKIAAMLKEQAQPPKVDPKKQIAQLEHQKQRLITAITQGVPVETVKDKLAEIETTLRQLSTVPEPVPMRKVERILPTIVDEYRQLVDHLQDPEALAAPDAGRARAKLRAMFGDVTARPEGRQVHLEVENGRFETAIVRALGGALPRPSDALMVAGAGFEPATFGL